MFKQYIALILLLIFNFILVGHSVIPHDHGQDDHHHIKAHSHGHHHSLPHSKQQNDENDKKQSKGLSDFFSSVIHVSEYVNNGNLIKATEEIIHNYQSEIPLFSFHSTTSFLATDLNSEGIHYRDPDYHPPKNSHKGLRAPPLFFS